MSNEMNGSGREVRWSMEGKAKTDKTGCLVMKLQCLVADIINLTMVTVILLVWNR